MTPRKRLRRYHNPGDLHEFTFSTYQRRLLLVNDTRCQILVDNLDAAGNEFRFDLVAFVFMPEHVHLLTYPRDESPEFGRYLARIKQPTSREIKAALSRDDPNLLADLMVQERSGKSCFRFWQQGAGFDRNLFSIEAIQNAIDYIHLNPVRRGLREAATEWKWSSVRYYLSETGDPARNQSPLVHGVPKGLFD